jgi:hypothetical protein
VLSFPQGKYQLAFKNVTSTDNRLFYQLSNKEVQQWTLLTVKTISLSQ